MKVLIIASAAFAALAACASVNTAPPPPAGQERTGNPVRMMASPLPFDATVARLEAALDARPLTRFATIDHAAGAEKAGLDLRPMKLFIFGNPKAGTRFMQAEPMMGLELPLRILVVGEDAGASVIYPDIRALAASYGVSSKDAPVDRVADTLEAIVMEAIGQPAS